MAVTIDGTTGINAPAVTGLTTPVSVANGGTGTTTLTSNNVILGNGTSAVQSVAPGTNGNVLTSNGTTWVSATPSSGSLLRMTVYQASTTWTKGANTKYVKVTVTGGGGGGAAGATASGTDYGASGGAAGTAIKFFDVTAISTVTVTVGAAGTGGATAGANGTNGGNSSFGIYGTGNGGVGATGATSGAGGTATAGDINLVGGRGISRVGTGTSNSNQMPGGTSFWGGSSNSDASFGAGGTGGAPSSGGFNGGAGVVVVEEYA